MAKRVQAFGLYANANREKAASKVSSTWGAGSSIDPHTPPGAAVQQQRQQRLPPRRHLYVQLREQSGHFSPAVPSGERISRTRAPGSGSALLSRSQMTLPLRPISLSGRDIFWAAVCGKPCLFFLSDFYK